MRRRLRALCHLALLSPAAAWAAGDPIPPARVREVTRQVLAMREFSGGQSWYERWYEAAVEFIQRMIARALEWLFERLHLGASPSTVSTIAIIVAFVVVALILLLIILVVFRRVQSGAGSRTADGERTRIEDMSPDRALSEAAAAAAAGDYLRAFRLVYLASLLLLDRGGLVRYDRSRTNWEYVGALRGKQAAPLAAFTSFTSDFDRKVYGGDSVTAQDYSASLRAYSSIAEMAGSKL